MARIMNVVRHKHVNPCNVLKIGETDLKHPNCSIKSINKNLSEIMCKLRDSVEMKTKPSLCENVHLRLLFWKHKTHE